jgi:hypothetical protein
VDFVLRLDFVVVVNHFAIRIWREEAWPYVVVVGAKCNGEEGALTTRSVDNSFVWLPGLDDRASMRFGVTNQNGGRIMAKGKKRAKVQKRGKLPKGKTASRGKARKVAKAAKTKAVARAKPKHAPVKKAATKVKPPVAPIVETVAVEVIEQPAPGVITVTEVEETEVRKAS